VLHGAKSETHPKVAILEVKDEFVLLFQQYDGTLSESLQTHSVHSRLRSRNQHNALQ
jgi:hypothetical protein